MSKKIFIFFSFFTFFYPLLRAESELYLESSRQFLLNPAVQDTSVSMGAKFFAGDDQVSEYHLSFANSSSRFCYSFDGDYFYFSRFRRLKATCGVGYRAGFFSLGNNFFCSEDSEGNKDFDYSAAGGFLFAPIESYLIWISAKNNRWAVEFRRGKRVVFRLDEGNFLLSTDVPICQFSSLQVSLRKSTIGAGVKLFWSDLFLQFSVIYHRYVDPDYLLSIGADL